MNMAAIPVQCARGGCGHSRTATRLLVSTLVLLFALLDSGVDAAAVEVGSDTLELSGDGVSVALAGNFVPAAAEEVPALREMSHVVGAASEDFGARRTVAVLTLTPWSAAPAVAPGLVGLRKHLDDSTAALIDLAGIEVVHSRVVNEDETVPIGLLDVRRWDPGLARQLGFGDDAGVRQLGFIAPCQSGLAQLFVFVGLDSPDERVESLVSRIPAAMTLAARPVAQQERSSGSTTPLLIVVLAVTLALVVALRVYSAVHRRRARAAAARHLGADPSSPRPPGDTPMAPWEDDLRQRLDPSRDGEAGAAEASDEP